MALFSVPCLAGACKHDVLGPVCFPSVALYYMCIPCRYVERKEANANRVFQKTPQDVRAAVGGVLGARRAAAGLHVDLAGSSVRKARAGDQDDGEGVPSPDRRVHQS